VTPDTDDFNTRWSSRALDAATAAAHTVEACSANNLEPTLRVAEVTWEAAFGEEQRGVRDAVFVEEQAQRGGLDRQRCD
jgi:hypothetical protein